MLTKDIKENFPFLSVVTYGGQEYIGVISNQDQYVTTMYVYTNLKTDFEKKAFLDLADVWWWESNRMIPINIFMPHEMNDFRYSMITMNSKDVKVTLGPSVNLNDLSAKRVKRRNIQLVKKPKD